MPAVPASRFSALDLLALVVAALLVTSAATVKAQKRATIEQIKAGVVGVGTFQRTRTPPFRFLGTGFAVGDGRAVATNAHVVAQVVDAGAAPEVLAVLLPPAEAGQQATIVEAARIAIDEEHDLAVLQMKSGRLPALALRADDAVQD